MKIDDLPEISFIDNLTVEELQSQLINDFTSKYEELTGNKLTLGQADPWRMRLYADSLQLYQAFQYVDRAGKLNLLKYAYGEYLDNVVISSRITRKEASKSTVKIRFFLSETKKFAVGVPEETKVTNGTYYFKTKEYAEIAIGSLYVDVDAECTTAGSESNNIAIGEINILVEPIAYVNKVSNITMTTMGEDQETDEQLANRALLADSSFPTAGSTESYEYWTKSFSTSIQDVKVTSPSNCQVNIYCILKNGEIPQQSMLDSIKEFLCDSKHKPLTDNITVLAASTVSYDIHLTYYINRKDIAQATSIQNAVNEAINEYKVWQQSKIGRDINPSELMKQVILAGAKRAVITSPAHLELSDTEIAQIGKCELVYGGLESD